MRKLLSVHVQMGVPPTKVVDVMVCVGTEVWRSAERSVDVKCGWAEWKVDEEVANRKYGGRWI
jgi:hypothetical protein